MHILVLTIVVLLIAVLLMSVKVLTVKGGKFPRGHADSAELRQRGVECASKMNINQ